jgi:N-acetylmuramoyl-L-alanine amidase
MFPPPTTRLWVTGQRGDELRVRLSASREAWIGADEVRRLPAGTPPPLTTVGAVSVDAVGRHTRVRMALGQRVPYEVRVADEDLIEILFFGATSNTDWMHYNNAPQGAVKRAEWFQDDSTTYRLRLHTHPGRWWGYDARYENGTFVLELRRPLANPKAPASLAGLARHRRPGPLLGPGGHRPHGVLGKGRQPRHRQMPREKIAAGARGGHDAAQRLRARGALRPPQGRLGGGGRSVNQRAQQRPARRGPTRLSATASGFTTTSPTGSAWRTRSTTPTASSSAAKGASPRLRDDGLHYGNLALPRTPQMPSVLTESAYLILPEEEALLKTEKFQCDCADVTVRGIKKFVEEIRRRDAATP